MADTATEVIVHIKYRHIIALHLEKSFKINHLWYRKMLCACNSTQTW